MMKVILTIVYLFVLPLAIFAQSDTTEYNKLKNEQVLGFINDANGKIIVTDKGYFLIKSKDPYQEYYRRIYKDSTIVNPNKVINGNNFEVNFIPIIYNKNLLNGFHRFHRKFNLGEIITISKLGKLTVTQQAIPVIFQKYNSDKKVHHKK